MSSQPIEATAIANKRIEDLAFAVYTIEKGLENGRLSDEASIDKGIKNLERSFYRLDALVRDAMEKNLFIFHPRLLARLLSLAIGQKISCRRSKKTGNLLFQLANGRRAEIRPNVHGGYVAFVHYTEYNGAQMFKPLMASNLINAIYQMSVFIQKTKYV